MLRNQRRRFAIHHLKRDRGPVDVGDLATQVAAWENGVSVEEVTSTQRRRVYNALKQTHLPELESTGLVDEDRGEVSLTDQAEHLDVYLELVPEKEIRWSEYYFGLGAVGLVAVTVAWLDIGPFSLFPDLAAGVFLAVALFVSAVAHHRYYRNRHLVGSDEKPPELRRE
ncbi:MAG: hypothetical protein ABEJ26_07570 [Halosimplex sp.]